MRVVVVGCGAIGAATALAASRAGHEVTILERFGPANAYGSSHGGARIFRLAYDDPAYVELAQRTLPLWREIERAAGAELLTTTGSVDHGDPAVLEAVRGALAAAGAESSMLDAETAAERWPGLRFEGDVHLDPAGGRLHAEAAVAAMLALSGAELRTERVLAVDHDRVTTDAGEHRAEAVVVAAGAWSGALLGLADPPVVTLEQPVHFAAAGTPARWPSFIHHRPDLALYGLDEPGAGVKLGEHGTGRTVDPDDLDRTPDPAGVERLVEYAREWLPGVDAGSARAVGCLYDTTPTHAPLIERLPSGVVVAAGTSGHGFKFAPELGRQAAELALSRS
jgi:sarcosine oxidase